MHLILFAEFALGPSVSFGSVRRYLATSTTGIQYRGTSWPSLGHGAHRNDDRRALRTMVLAPSCKLDAAPWKAERLQFATLAKATHGAHWLGRGTCLRVVFMPFLFFLFDKLKPTG